MIVALLNDKDDVGKTTLPLHLDGERARKGNRVILIDADPQGSALDWSERRAREGIPHPFGVFGLAGKTLHREVPELARDDGHIVFDGPPRIAGLMRSALLAAGLVPIPLLQPSFEGSASGETLIPIDEARIFRRQTATPFPLNRRAARTVMALEVADALADHEPPVLVARIGQHMAFADAAQPGRLVSELTEHSLAPETAAFALEVGGLAR